MEALLEKEAGMENWNDDRLDELSRRMDEGFKETKGEMREGFDRLERAMSEGFAQIDTRFAQIDTRFAQIDTRFAQTNERIDRLMLTLLIGALGLIGTLIGTAAF
jgi:hypothetical protein